MLTASVTAVAPTNALIALLSPTDRQCVLAVATETTFTFGVTLCGANAAIRHVYFPNTGYISLLTGNSVAARLEVGIVGNEGMFGATALLGIHRSPFQALVQGAGGGHRVRTADFTRLLANCPTLHDVISRYLYVSLAQLAQTAACNRSHQVGPRLSRWLLMTQDRAHCNVFPMTHAFLSEMLGVRRAGVTEAAQQLRRQGIIRYSRGMVTVLDRVALQGAACDCYLALRALYAGHMPTPKRRSPPPPLSSQGSSWRSSGGQAR